MNGIHDQGKAARQIADDSKPGDVSTSENKEAYFSAYAGNNCPYGPGANRDAWMKGFSGVPLETVKQTDAHRPDSASAPARVVEKGAKGKKSAATTVETKPSVGEGALDTVVTTDADDASAAGGTTGADVNVTDPNKSTTAAENGGAGVTTGVDAEDLM